MVQKGKVYSVQWENGVVIFLLNYSVNIPTNFLTNL